MQKNVGWVYDRGITVTQQQCQDINGNLDVTGTNPEAIWYLASTGLLYTDLERPGFCGGDTSCFGHPENPSCNDNTNFIEVPILEYSLDSDSQLFLIETGYRNDSLSSVFVSVSQQTELCVRSNMRLRHMSQRRMPGKLRRHGWRRAVIPLLP